MRLDQSLFVFDPTSYGDVCELPKIKRNRYKRKRFVICTHSCAFYTLMPFKRSGQYIIYNAVLLPIVYDSVPDYQCLQNHIQQALQRFATLLLFYTISLCLIFGLFLTLELLHMKLKIFTAFLLCIGITHLSAQPVIKASKTVGGANGTDNQTCMVKTTDGGFIAGGISNASMSADKTDSVRGKLSAFDFWLVKYTANGKIQMDKTIGGDKEDQLTCIIQTSDGGYLVGGYSASGIYADKTDTLRGITDYWIVRLNAQGKILWDKTYGGSGSDILTTFKETTDGGFILAGISNSNISGEKTQNRYGGSYDVWLVKTDGDGKVKWDKTLGDSYFDGCTSIFETADGGFILAGDTENSFTGGSDYMVIKTDATGNQQWRKLYGINALDDQDYLTKMIYCSDGNYLLAGYSDSQKGGTKTEPSKGGFDYWLVKIKADGTYLWDKTLGGTADEFPTDLMECSDGSYLVNGHSSSGISGDKTEPNRGVENTTDDYWTTKIDASGHLIWDKTIGGSESEISGSVIELHKGLFIVGGYSGSNISGDKKQNTKSGMINTYDFWLVTLYDNNASKQQPDDFVLQKEPEPFSVYPNPAKDRIYIQNKVSTTYIVTNASGNTLLSQTITGSGSINVSNLLPGTYYIKDMRNNVSKKVYVIR